MGKNIYMKVGPCGINKALAEEWDDGIFGRLLTIFIWHSNYGINSIQFAYVDQYGNRVLSARHGGDGTKFEMIRIGGPMCSISGWYKDGRGITSLTFIVSGHIYGPYGSDNANLGSPFCFNASGDYIKGFHGVANENHLMAIGVHVDTEVPHPECASPGVAP